MVRILSKLTAVLLAALLLAAAFPTLADHVDCDFIQSDPEDQEACGQRNEPDDRINPGSVEAAIYCTNLGVKIIDIDVRGAAIDSFIVPYEDIDAIGIPEVNTLIEDHQGFRLYRLTTGELQLNAPPNWMNSGEYVFIWDGCDQSAALEP
jgi:hypothetical protein